MFLVKSGVTDTTKARKKNLFSFALSSMMAGMVSLCLVGSCNTAVNIGNAANAATGHFIDAAPDNQARLYRAALENILITQQPAGLSELSLDHILKLYDKPALWRVEGNVQVLQYRSAQCVVEFYAVSGPDQRDVIAHYEMRPRRTATFLTDDTQSQAADSDAYSRACLRSLEI